MNKCFIDQLKAFIKNRFVARLLKMLLAGVYPFHFSFLFFYAVTKVGSLLINVHWVSHSIITQV